MQNVEATIGSQYANSPTMLALIGSWNDAIDPTTNLQQFYSFVWDIYSAQGWGQDNWGKILGVSRYVELTSAGEWFGVKTSDDSFAPLSQAPLYSGEALTTTFALSDEAYQKLLLAKAFANISNVSIQALNTLVQTIFGPGAMCVLDLGAMAMAYVWAATPSAVNVAIAEGSGVLPHPTGVNTTFRTALLYNAVLAAGTSGSNVGFASGYGSLTPAVDGNGNSVVEASYNSGTLTLQISSTSTLTSVYFTTLTVGGISLAASAATFTSVGGGVYQWVWTASPITLTNGVNYSLLIT